MIELIANLLPLFILISLGAFLRGHMPQETWAGVERLLFYVLFPAFAIHELSHLPDLDDDQIRMAASVLASGILVGAITFIYLLKSKVAGPSLTSVLQGVARYNIFVALAAASFLFGTSGLGLAALLVAVMTLPNNMTSVWILAKYGSNGSKEINILSKVLRNPNIIGCLIGIIIWLSNYTIPSVIAEPLGLLSRATLPLSLLAVGAGIIWELPKGHLGLILLTSVLKLFIVPAITFIIALQFGLSGLPLAIAVLYSAVPAATSGYVMARQMGGDAGLMANILTVQTLFGLLTMPLWVYIVQNI